MARSLAEDAASPSVKIGRVRWVIVGLLFAATAINYVDRQMIGLLKPTLQGEFGWHETTYADIVFYFQLAYAVGYIFFGNIVDRIGARLGYAAAFTIWTCAHMLHAVAHSVLGFAAAEGRIDEAGGTKKRAHGPRYSAARCCCRKASRTTRLSPRSMCQKVHPLHDGALCSA